MASAPGPPRSGLPVGAAGVGPAPAVVEVREVSRWYGQVIALANVWMRVEGGIVGLLGPNGAGKSTLMKILAGLMAPSRGVALVHGRSLWHDAEARRRLGYCPEHGGVYDELTAREFVTAMAGSPASSRRSRVSARRRRSTRWASRTRWTAASRGIRRACVSARSWPRPSCTTPTCCCSTSRSPAVTAPRARRSSRASRFSPRPARSSS
ncbi:MAG: ATP-binding cassette domain-containing protein [Polyangiaceae bacterium]|nr:ATP-binding cassette domain-containing protein [Polyangiaceae bacterium]